MSALRTSLRPQRLPRSFLTHRSPQLFRPATAPSRFAGSKALQDPSSQLNQDSRVSLKEEPTGALVEHEVDFDIHIDEATSFVLPLFHRNFSPVPKRVMDGSEPGDELAAAVLSGAPIDLQARTVRIYRPAKTATQSGTWHGHQWRMDWDVLGKGHRWENPLMGWQSSADGMQGTHVSFNTKEDAIRFAQKQGYEYFVQEPNERKFVPKAYANNFMHSPGKLKIVRTK